MTDWNARYKAGDTPWEKGAAGPPLLELLGKTERKIWGSGMTLVPGCGTGHDVRALAAAGITAVGLDLAQEAIERAGNYPQISDESYQLGNFLDPDFEMGNAVSAIWEHTCYCAIDPSSRPAYAAACARLLKSGGHLIGVFFLTPQGPGEEDQGPPFNASIAELDERFAPWFDRVDAWAPEHTYPGREGKEWLAIYRKR